MASIMRHLPRWIRISDLTVQDEPGRAQPQFELLEERLLLSASPTGIDIEKYVRVEPVSDTGDIMCKEYAYGKPVTLTMGYTGGGANATDTAQWPGKYAVIDEPGFVPYEALDAYIIASSEKTFSSVATENTLFNGQVALGGEFVLDVANATALDQFKANTYIYISDLNDNLLQTVQYHTSCSAPIVLGDVVGGIEVRGFFGTNGIGANVADADADPDDCGADADDPTGGDAPDAPLGERVVWTYVVTNVDQGPLADIVVTDDNGTPANDADDFHPTPVLDGDFNVGDTNTDGMLDVGEEWLYTATGIVEAEGLYGNTAHVVGTAQGGDSIDYAVLGNDSVGIGNSVTVLGGLVGSNSTEMFSGDVYAGMDFVAPVGVRGGGSFYEDGGSSIGTAATPPEDVIVFNGDVWLGSTMTTVNGNIVAGGMVDTFGATANGSIDEYITAPLPFVPSLFPAPLPVTPGSVSLTNPVTLAPGSYDVVTVDDGGGLSLNSGDYHFNSLTLGIGASLTLTLSGGPIGIYVAGSVAIDDGFTMSVTGGTAEQIYAQVGNWYMGANATWFGTIYAPDGMVTFGSDLVMAGAAYGKDIFFENDSVITAEPVDFAAVRVEIPGSAVFSDSDSAHYIGILSATAVCMTGQKPQALVMQYAPGGTSSHSQDPDKVTVVDYLPGEPTVRIVAASKADINDPKAKIYFDGQVDLGETFAIDAVQAGEAKLTSETHVFIFALGGELLQTVRFHTSCSQPLILGNQFGALRLFGFLGEDGAREGGLPVELLTGLSGFVFEDFNGDGLIDLNEYAVEGVTVTLTGTDDQGNAVSRTDATDADGVYYFDGLRPGTYAIAETQPTGYTSGINSVGTAGGTLLAGDTISDITLEAYVEGENYNFGEQRQDAGAAQVAVGQTATIGFWAGKKGKKLIESLNGGKHSTALGDWLAAEFPNTYGKLAGKKNKDVAKFYRRLFKSTKKDKKGEVRELDAQVMATVLAVYVTDWDLAGDIGTQYGFAVTADGVGAATFNVGDSYAAFGLQESDSRIMTIWAMLNATDDQTVEGRLYDLDIALRQLANKAYKLINEFGCIE